MTTAFFVVCVCAPVYATYMLDESTQFIVNDDKQKRRNSLEWGINVLYIHDMEYVHHLIAPS